MERCDECRGAHLVPCADRIARGTGGEIYDPPVPALRCQDCGRMQANAPMIESSRRATMAPPGEKR